MTLARSRNGGITLDINEGVDYRKSQADDAAKKRRVCSTAAINHEVWSETT